MDSLSGFWECLIVGMAFSWEDNVGQKEEKGICDSLFFSDKRKVAQRRRGGVYFINSIFRVSERPLVSMR
jgi:hypothetical protein